MKPPANKSETIVRIVQAYDCAVCGAPTVPWEKLTRTDHMPDQARDLRLKTMQAGRPGLRVREGELYGEWMPQDSRWH